MTPVIPRHRHLVAALGAGLALPLAAAAADMAAPAPRAAPLDALALWRAAYVGLLLLTAGGAAFIALVAVPAEVAARLRRGVALLAVLAAAAGAGYLLAVARATGDSPGALLAGPALGNSLVVAAGGVIVVLAASLVRPVPAFFLAGAVLLAASRALTGHPVLREPGALLMVLMTLHACAAAWWAGSLWPLHVVLGRESPAAAAPVVERFSSLAMAAVATLAFAGIIMALVFLSSPSALLGTWFGNLILMKTNWFTVLMGIAAWHKLSLAPRLARGDPVAARRMRWGIRVDAVIMVLVVIISTLLAATDPGALPPGAGPAP